MASRERQSVLMSLGLPQVLFTHNKIKAQVVEDTADEGDTVGRRIDFTTTTNDMPVCMSWCEAETISQFVLSFAKVSSSFSKASAFSAEEYRTTELGMLLGFSVNNGNFSNFI